MDDNSDCYDSFVGNIVIRHNIREMFPPCDGETIFVGINTAGFCGCFNNYDVALDVCLYETAEECITVMSCLKWWDILDMPKQL